MVNQAIAKLKAEMHGSKDNQAIQRVGEFLIKHLDKNHLAAEKILVADKTITKSFDEMRKAAEKQKSGNIATLTDDEGFSIVLNYFGIQEQAAAAAPNINLDSLLGF